jgi:hypothetical protein
MRIVKAITGTYVGALNNLLIEKKKQIVSFYTFVTQ